MDRAVAGMFVGILVAFATSFAAHSQTAKAEGEKPLRLGNFSVSLAVKDIAASKAFYEKLGFKKVMGDEAKKWLILQNDQSTIGLFQGAFEKNTLTYNPGWDRASTALTDFDDVRDIQKALKQKGLALSMTADESSTGPAGVMVTDPDGNPILIDQHVPSPKKK
jgi:predicted lactoylglutathione lyase